MGSLCSWCMPLYFDVWLSEHPAAPSSSWILYPKPSSQWPGYHTCGNIKGKEKNSQKGKGERGEKGNFLRFISIVILPMIKKSRKSSKIYCTLHYIYIIFWTVQIKNYVDLLALLALSSISQGVCWLSFELHEAQAFLHKSFLTLPAHSSISHFQHFFAACFVTMTCIIFFFLLGV